MAGSSSSSRGASAPRRSPLPAPAGLSEGAVAAWDEIVEAMREAGREPRGRDLVAMEMLAVATCRARDARAAVDRDGALVYGARDTLVPHPALSIERQAMADIRQFRASLGLAETTGGVRRVATGGAPGRPVGSASAPDRAAAREGEPPRLTVVRP